MYTLQTQYLARYPLDLPWYVALAILSTGVGGYLVFRAVNHQKDLARRTKGDCLIWGRPAKMLTCSYTTADGGKHESQLLISGWWGLVRHGNYFGDLFLSFSMCACCGCKHLLPWTYAIFMTILLLHRCSRDEQRCLAKYGEKWKDYCRLVPYKIIPGVY
jgi:7-dehydrocholesterol reductase